MHFWWWKIGHNLPIKKRQNSGFQWELKHLPTAQIWDTPKKEATYTEDRYHRKGYIIVNNNLCFLMLFFFVLCMSRWIWKLCNIGSGCWTLEACQEFGWHCGVIWQELCKLAFIFGCRLASGRIPFFHGIHLYIHRYNPHTTPMAYGNNRYLNMSPDLARAPRKQVVQSLARSLSRLRLLTVNFAEGELCWKG